ncbi:Mitochondrial glycoprotein [Quillaja saponaria]|uniref:Mitochondrial glycoprotein n=1 Tax=Quillaja saponaria TaxID=32244 RepID=A0AAD7VIB1_QUISA|nr:Mitochondrial glycoprotein [Quillaja saponaria]
MPRVIPVLREGRKALRDLNLLKVLQSEIKDELSSDPFQNKQNGSPGDFKVEWESPESKDVVLRRKCKSGEEVAVSALLGPVIFERDGIFPRDVLMKVCVKKPGMSPMLQFNCNVFEKHNSGFEFDIYSAYYLQSPRCLGSSVYRGPLFSDLDPQLQVALKEYLVAKGIGEGLTNFLFFYLNKREQGQYVNWLKRLESFVA